MSDNNQSSRPPVSSPSTTSDSLLQNFSIAIFNIVDLTISIYIYNSALPELTDAIDAHRNGSLNKSELTKTIFGIYEHVPKIVTLGCSHQEGGDLRQRGSKLFKDALALHRIFDPRGAEAAVERYHLSEFVD
ncbi:hypothetical protein EAE96_002954 [Botrytis aclada]|nr:hypothetical protein EAE96_002954 [Botrytis aclada]